ncbi:MULTISPECIES: polysaccharide deacetylase family protein [Clostridium]|uniref:Polysaccharide deacetylase n=1 Tax=Clostridium senegalense TaxID=1465809 RepID=A0A6M0GXW6_9CLOT|nr:MULTISPECIES: polysaccharide deacetylase family protein [Clostridium]NEU03446.1 polysaccharide deacetylase [Clostridium senegalense]
MKRKNFFIVTIIISVIIFTSISVLAISDDSKCKENDKIVYLTFDDGPTETTLEVLKILDEENIKATFFVIGKLVEENPNILKEIKEKNHSICAHTYTHNDSNYVSADVYFNDYEKVKNVLNENLNKKNYEFMRMPGGSSTGIPQKSTLKQIRDGLISRGLYYVDWNISIEDAMGINIPVEQLICNYSKAMNSKNLDKSRIIILMHDGASNKTTPKALGTIIKSLKEQGYEFKSLDMVDEKEREILIEKKLINRYN